MELLILPDVLLQRVPSQLSDWDYGGCHTQMYELHVPYVSGSPTARAFLYSQLQVTCFGKYDMYLPCLGTHL
jgi:hypothetical protein